VAEPVALVGPAELFADVPLLLHAVTTNAKAATPEATPNFRARESSIRAIAVPSLTIGQ
jgi:hypothetical protein